MTTKIWKPGDCSVYQDACVYRNEFLPNLELDSRIMQWPKKYGTRKFAFMKSVVSEWVLNLLLWKGLENPQPWEKWANVPKHSCAWWRTSSSIRYCSASPYPSIPLKTEAHGELRSIPSWRQVFRSRCIPSFSGPCLCHRSYLPWEPHEEIPLKVPKKGNNVEPCYCVLNVLVSVTDKNKS